MKRESRVMVRNLAFVVSGEAVSGALTFATFILIARHLGASEFGVFSYILAFVGIVQLLADCGVTNVLVREIARDRSQASRIMGAIRPLAWASSLAAFGLIAAIGWPLSTTSEIYGATLLLGLSVLATFHSFCYSSVCRAFEEMGYNAAGNVSHKLLTITLVGTALSLDTGVIGVGAATLAANIYQWLFFAVVVRRRYTGRVVWHYDLAYWRYLLVEALPIGMAMVLRRANLHIGTLVLTALSTTTSVGLFSAAYKVVQMVDMIPFTLSMPLFPPFARLAQESMDSLFALLTRALRMFMILAAPIAVWIAVMAPWLIDSMFGQEYADAVPTLRILSAAVLCLFVSSLYAYLFSALGRQRFYSLSSAACLAVNLVAGAILIPAHGHVGAAVAALVAELVFCASGAWLLYRLGYRPPVLRMLAVPLALAAAAASVLTLLPSSGFFATFLVSLLYGALYLLLVVVSGALSSEERTQLLSFVMRRPARPQEA